jgi:hypothetical protein
MRNALVPIFADPANQMSFGERAALVGLLEQIEPRLSLEIGTYEGGSLRWIAEHSDHVDTFDLDDLVYDRTGLLNVSFHQGDSKVTVPRVLAWYTEQGIAVDFVLIDGDHSSEGVRTDLEHVLDSPACARTVIAVHDAGNEEARHGIQLVEAAAHPRVVYVEPDFVPGYEFADGDVRGQRWGGLALIITGDRNTDGYGEHPLQTRYVPTFELMRRGQHAVSP